MPDFVNLADDIYSLLQNGKKGDDGSDESLSPKLLSASAIEIAKSMRKQVMPDDRGPRPPNTLYASEIGKPCKRELWMKLHEPEHGMKMHGAAKFKFMYGDVIESLTLWLAREAGHEVEHQQYPVETYIGRGWKVRGRIDAVVDGVLVDVKSAAPTAMGKFKSGLNDHNDAFGYRSQLGIYLDGVVAAGIVEEKSKAAFIAVDKATGEIVLNLIPKAGLEYEMADEVLEMLESPTNEFPRLKPAATGEVSMACRYCAFMTRCWPKAKAISGPKGKPIVVTGE